MTVRKSSVELREFERYILNDGVVALSASPAPRFGRIRNISLGGMSVCHFDSENWEEHAPLSDITLAGYDFLLHDVPTRIIADIEVAIENPYKEISERQCFMQFGELTLQQRTSLEDIIQQHSINERLPGGFPENIPVPLIEGSINRIIP